MPSLRRSGYALGHNFCWPTILRVVNSFSSCYWLLAGAWRRSFLTPDLAFEHQLTCRQLSRQVPARWLDCPAIALFRVRRETMRNGYPKHTNLPNEQEIKGCWCSNWTYSSPSGTSTPLSHNETSPLAFVSGRSAVTMRVIHALWQSNTEFDGEYAHAPATDFSRHDRSRSTALLRSVTPPRYTMRDQIRRENRCLETSSHGQCTSLSAQFRHVRCGTGGEDGRGT